MRVKPIVHKALAAVVALGTLGIGAPGAMAADPTPPAPAKPSAKCGPSSDSQIRYSGIGIITCDDPRLAAIGQAENQVVIIDDAGFHPKEITVGNGGGLAANVTFVNLGTQTHSATQLPISPMWNSGLFVGIGQNDRSAKNKSGTMTGGNVFDTGGITPMPGATVEEAIRNKAFVIATFGDNGDWVYSSYPDCIAGDRPQQTSFDCTPAIIHTVDNQEDQKSVEKVLGKGATWIGSTLTGTSLRPAGDPECATLGTGIRWAPGRVGEACISQIRKSFAKEPTGTKRKPLQGNITVTIDDIYGFDPDAPVIAAGSSITFLNKPTNKFVHSVAMDKKFHDFGEGFTQIGPGQFKGGVRSGGLAPGDSWTVTLPFVASSTVKYTPDTEVDTLMDVENGNIGGKEAFIGKITTVCPPGTFTPLAFDQKRGVGRPCTANPPDSDPAVWNAAGPIKDY
jgi:plastocyanin